MTTIDRLNAVIQATAEHYQLPVTTLTGTDRSHSVSLARKVSMYLAVTVAKVTPYSLMNVFDGRKYSTIVAGIKSIEKRLQEEGLEDAIEAIRNRIAGISEDIEASPSAMGPDPTTEDSPSCDVAPATVPTWDNAEDTTPCEATTDPLPDESSLALAPVPTLASPIPCAVTPRIRQHVHPPSALWCGRITLPPSLLRR